LTDEQKRMYEGEYGAGMQKALTMVAIMNDIPMMHKLDKNPLEVIQTGDYVIMNATEVIVEVIKTVS